MNFQKQFDTITGALNIFDMSYLVSGAAMLMVLVYAFPEVRAFVYHENQITLSIVVSIIVTYILGLICWIFGKQICCIIIGSHVKFFKKQVDEVLDKLPHDNDKITKLREMGQDMAFSYMWLKLDNENDANCRNRYLYISRFWVMRAIYEGLIPSVIVLSLVFLFKGQTIFCIKAIDCSWCMKTLVMSMANVVLSTWLANIIWLILVIGIMTVTIVGLGREAEKCVKTQVREVVVAYYDFYVLEENCAPTLSVDMTGSQQNV